MDTIIFQAAQEADAWEWGWNAVAALATFGATVAAFVLPYVQRRLARKVAERSAAPAIIAELDRLIELAEGVGEAINSRLEFNGKIRAELDHNPTTEELAEYFTNPSISRNILDYRRAADSWKDDNESKLRSRVKPEVAVDRVTQLGGNHLAIAAGLESTLVVLEANYVTALVRARAVILRAAEDLKLAFGRWQPSEFSDVGLEEMKIAVDQIVSEAKSLRGAVAKVIPG